MGVGRCVGRALEQRRMKQVVKSLPLWLNSQETSTSSHCEAQGSLRGLQWRQTKVPVSVPASHFNWQRDSSAFHWELRLLLDPSASFSSFSHCFLWFSSLSLHLCLPLPLFLSLSLSICPSPCTLKSHYGCVSLSIPGSWGKVGGRAGVQGSGMEIEGYKLFVTGKQ